MADKEATVYVVDVGKSMGLKRNERNETDLNFALEYIWDKIATTVRNEDVPICDDFCEAKMLTDIS